MLANSSLLYKHSIATELIGGCEKKRLSLVWFFDICGLQFEMVREVCCDLVWFWFYNLMICALLSFGMLQLLDLICDSLFDLCVICFWYLWSFRSLVCIWFFGFVFVRDGYLDVFEIWVYESSFTLICIILNLLW